LQDLTKQDIMSGSLAIPEDLVVRASSYLEEADAVATRRAHRSDWKDWETWSILRGCPALPASPQSLVLYITHLARTRKVSTIVRRLASISVAHQAADLETPTRSLIVRRCIEGVRRELGTRPTQKKPIVLATLRRMLSGLPETTAGKRDRALLLFTFAAALRRSEVTALNREDIEFGDKGVLVLISKSKTDQTGSGEEIAVPFARDPAVCAVTALQDWLTAAGIKSGPLFRPVTRHGKVQGRMNPRAVATIVKRHADRVGLDSVTIGAHSLRAGFVTTCAAAGVSERATMATTRHKSVEVFRGYVRHASIWTENAASEIL
jgi:integrase